jgi:fructokinase
MPIKPVITGIGELLWDMLPGGLVVGGAPGNLAFMANELGSHGIIVSCVGKDEPGDVLLNHLERAGMSREYVDVTPQHPTGFSRVQVGPDGNPVFAVEPEVAWDYIPWNHRLAALAKKADVITFGTLGQRSEVSRETVRKFVIAAPETTFKIFDINLRKPFYSRETVLWGLEACNVLKTNDGELKTVAGMLELHGDATELVKRISERFSLKLVALTRGPDGSVIYSDGRFYEHPGYRAKAVDAVGCGDAFTAVLAIGLTSKTNIEVVNDRANRVASFVCTQPGATPRLPDELKAPAWGTG